MSAIQKYNQSWLPSIFNDFFDNNWMLKMGATVPAINVIENEKDYRVDVAAPGMTKEDFDIHVGEGNQLVISMEKKSENNEKGKEGEKYLRREFAYTAFRQAFDLPDNVDAEHISAAMENGVLEITLPKLQADTAKASRVIEIH